MIRIGDVRLVLTDGRGATLWSELLQAPVILFDLASDFAQCPRIALAPADQAGKAELAQAVGLMQAAGMEVSVLDDFPGLLVMRTVAMLANEAADVVHTGVASAEAVDQAMRLGVNYPSGPLAWAEAIGLGRVVRRARPSGAHLRRGPLPRLVAPAAQGARQADLPWLIPRGREIGEIGDRSRELVAKAVRRPACTSATARRRRSASRSRRSARASPAAA